MKQNCKNNAKVKLTTSVKGIKTAKSSNNFTHHRMIISYRGLDVDSCEWIEPLVQLCNRVQKESHILSYESLYLLNTPIKPLAELGSDKVGIIERGDYVILMSATKAISMAYLMNSLIKACRSEVEKYILADCYISILTSKQNFDDRELADDIDVQGIIDCYAELGASSDDPMNLLFGIIMEAPASTRYYFSKFFSNQGLMLQSLELVVSAATDNYKPAVEFMENLNKDIIKSKNIQKQNINLKK